MGRKRLEAPSAEAVNSMISKILVPAHILEHFAIWNANESKARWVIELREKAGKIPSALSKYEDVVLDGYCNPLEILSNSFVCKPIYLRLFRRRYKRSNSDEHHSNEYNVTLEGIRIVPEMGIFLKEES